jgi:hypothetical protein
MAHIRHVHVFESLGGNAPINFIKSIGGVPPTAPPPQYVCMARIMMFCMYLLCFVDKRVKNDQPLTTKCLIIN